mgnify:CR=1 FL=1
MKYFVTSDIHSYYSLFKKFLDKSGFDPNNPDHTLIICGDVFDRGEETKELYNYLMSLDQSRLVLVRGNHEDLFVELLDKDFPQSHDFHNRTVNTFCQIAGFNPEVLSHSYWYHQAYKDNVGYQLYDTRPYECWKQIVEIVKMSPITKWIKSDVWKDYYEIDNYVFVHSFVPTALKEELRGDPLYMYYPAYELPNHCLEYRPDWRNATSYEWSEARWGNPFSQYDLGFYKDDKYLVHGHWHCSDGHLRYEDVLKGYEDYTPCIHEKLISIDACTAYSELVNILIIDGNKKQYYSEALDKIIDLKPASAKTTSKKKKNK